MRARGATAGSRAEHRAASQWPAPPAPRTRVARSGASSCRRQPPPPPDSHGGLPRGAADRPSARAAAAAAEGPSRRPPAEQLRGDASDDEEEEEEDLSEEEVRELIVDAAGFICVMDELRPLDPAAYNPFYEVWTRIARIPPTERYRLVDELEPGAVRSLWKASVGRYVLDEARGMELFESASVWDDFPMAPGQVFAYEGRCERYRIVAPRAPSGPAGLSVPNTRFELDSERMASHPALSATPLLRPSATSFDIPTTRFKQLFFVPPSAAGGGGGASGGGGGVGQRVAPAPASALPKVYSRVLLPFVGPVHQWWDALYSRLHVELTLTPVQADAGADVLLLYPSDPLCGLLEEEGSAQGGSGSGSGSGGTGSGASAGSATGVLAGVQTVDAATAEPLWDLVTPDDVPPGLQWAPPDPARFHSSPLGGGSRDFMRVAGPGVYVGCAYREGPAPGEYRDENHVYFLIARRT